MKLIYTAAFNIYSVLLLLIIPLIILAKVLVGAAGHNSGFTTEDYVAMGFIILTLVLLAIVYYVPTTNLFARKVFIFTTAICIAITLLYAIEILISNIKEASFSSLENTYLAVIFLLILSGVLLILGLVRNRIYKQL